MSNPYASRASILSQDCKNVKTPPIRIPRPTQKTHKTCIYKHYESRRDLQHLHLDEHYAIIHKSLTESRRALCTTITISTIHTPMIMQISTSIIHKISTRIMHEMGKTMRVLHIDTMHDRI